MWIRDYRAAPGLGPCPHPPCLMGTREPGLSVSPSNGLVLVSERLGRKGLGSQGSLSSKPQETTRPSSCLQTNCNHGFSNPKASPFSKERPFGIGLSLCLIMKSAHAGRGHETLRVFVPVCVRAHRCQAPSCAHRGQGGPRPRPVLP